MKKLPEKLRKRFSDRLKELPEGEKIPGDDDYGEEGEADQRERLYELAAASRIFAHVYAVIARFLTVVAVCESTA